MEHDKPCVWNRHSIYPANAIYIGRPSKWGNPFIIGKDGTRERVIEKYEEYLKNSPKLLTALSELEGHDLVCYCYPQACHGDVLLRLANPGEAK